jgi:hypothetical protein
MPYRRLLVLSLLLGAPVFLTAQTTPKKTPRSAPSAEAPLTKREKATQLLNRFTFGPRPGDIDAVIKAGPQSWFEEQLNPASIPGTHRIELSDEPDPAPDLRGQAAHAQ